MKLSLCRGLPVVGLAITALAHLVADQPTGHYNVILLIADEHNAGVLGCYGDPLVKTPTLDSLAARGIRFTAAYCQNPICVPSRTSLVSGRMPSNLKVFDNGPEQNTQKYENITTLADIFTGNGYQVAWFGKTHWGNPRFPVTEGQRRYARAAQAIQDENIGRLPSDARIVNWPVERNAEHIAVDEAVMFLEHNKNQRFFLGVSLLKPHFPYAIQEKYYDMYRSKVSSPYAPRKLLAEMPESKRDEMKSEDTSKSSNEDILRAKAMYYGMVTYIDEELGRLLRKLDDLGLREKTIILYTADHGEMLGERGLWYKNCFYEGAARVPFLWSFPAELPQGKVIAAPVMNMDIFPTLVELCQLPKPVGLEGASLAPLMKGVDNGANRFALSENYWGNYAGRMIRQAEWKYFFYLNGEEALYDIQADPREEVNLARDSKHQKLVMELKAKASTGWVQPDRSIAEILELRRAPSTRTDSGHAAGKDPKPR